MEASKKNTQAVSMRWIGRDEVVRSCSYNFLMQGEIEIFCTTFSATAPFSGRYNDCILCCEGLSIPCHQIVLASCSPYFDVSF